MEVGFRGLVLASWFVGHGVGTASKPWADGDNLGG